MLDYEQTHLATKEYLKKEGFVETSTSGRYTEVITFVKDYCTVGWMYSPSMHSLQPTSLHMNISTRFVTMNILEFKALKYFLPYLLEYNEKC